MAIVAESGGCCMPSSTNALALEPNPFNPKALKPEPTRVNTLNQM